MNLTDTLFDNDLLSFAYFLCADWAESFAICALAAALGQFPIQQVWLSIAGAIFSCGISKSAFVQRSDFISGRDRVRFDVRLVAGRDWS